MREADRRECIGLGRTPKQSLRLGLIASEMCWTAKVDGRPEAMMGLVVESAISGEGTPWFLGTDEVYRHGREMVAWGPRILRAMLDSTPRLSNLVGSFNRPAIRLLRRWGFEVREEVIMSAGGVEFFAFSMGR
jgi:hypothetical protein